ncbi:MAG: M28 family peptidase [Candidatus Fermentithermobacillus carboniphilus]|uniref:M28 family peptidase n=1 Tax=Candidatus Fermentithermobacillus carboniphilus TaxID=3085328 RepID=A0AAT9LFM4_9FIRM|nr:MAG: M28 family peptidase [Candidatus Fermentithermobacillus carboniphilus]
MYTRNGSSLRVVWVLVFLASLFWLTSRSILSMAFDPALYDEVLANREVRLALTRVIVDMAAPDPDYAGQVEKALDAVLTPETLASYFKEIMPQAKRFLDKKGYDRGVVINVAGLKNAFASELEKAGLDTCRAEAIVKSLPDELDLVDYVPEEILDYAVDQYRYAGTVPRLGAALWFVSILLLGKVTGPTTRFLTCAGSALVTSVIFGAAFVAMMSGWPLRLLGQVVNQNYLALAPLLVHPRPGEVILPFFRNNLVFIIAGSLMFLMGRYDKFLLGEKLTGIFTWLGKRFKDPVARLRPFLSKSGCGHISPASPNIGPGAGPLPKKVSPAVKIGYLLCYILIAAAIPLFFSSRMFTSPEKMLSDLSESLTVWEGPAEFSGQNAYEYVEEIVTRFPVRMAGSEGSRKSAEWVKERFQEYGLDVHVEEFTCAVPESRDKLKEKPYWTRTIGDMVAEVPGVNVVAESPGKSPEVVLIGAHRDARGYNPGAEDNASGTATMLELARVLSRAEHHYTYVFVSFDAEEIGLKGSSDFCRRHRNLPIKLAIILDMTGFNLADTIGFYPGQSNKGASPLWTLALGTKVAGRETSLPIQFLGQTLESTSTVVSFWNVRAALLESRVPTDSGSFVDRGIPALGVLAGLSRGDKGPSRQIHSSDDTLEQVSAGTLGMVGRFCERYVKSLELNDFRGALQSRDYFVSGNRAMGPLSLLEFTLYCFLILAGFAGLSWTQSRMPVAFLKSQLKWLFFSLVVPMPSGVFPYLFASPSMRGASFFGLHTAWFVLTLGGLVVLTAARARTCTECSKVLSWQSTLLSLVYALTFLAVSVVSNVFWAINILFLPVVFFGRLSSSREDIRLLGKIAIVVWTLSKFVTSSAFFRSFMIEAPDSITAFLKFADIFVWAVTCLYTVTPCRRLPNEQ